MTTTTPKFKIGTDDFSELLAQGGYFVDKTPMIREIVNGNTVVLLPRPRRFGKTLAMSMLRYFFEKSTEDRRPLYNPWSIIFKDLESHPPANIRKLGLAFADRRVRISSTQTSRTTNS